MDRGDAQLNGASGAAWLNSTGTTGHLHPTIPYTLLSVLRHLRPKTQPAPGPASAGTRGGTSKVSRTLNLGNPWYLLQDHCGWESVSPSQPSAPKDAVCFGATEGFIWSASLGCRVHLE